MIHVKAGYRRDDHSMTGRQFMGCARVLILAALLAGPVMAAIAQQPATVKLWNWNIHDKKYQQKMYKLFNERHPDIKIEFSSILNTVYPQVLEAAYIAGESPDLFYPSGKLSFKYLLNKGWIKPLSECAPDVAELKKWMDQFPPFLYRFTEGTSVIDGKPYVVGLQGESGSAGFPMYYNKTLFKQAGIAKPPAIQKELIETAAKITQAGQGWFFGITHGMKYRPSMWTQDLAGSLAAAAGARGTGPIVLGWTPDLKTGKYNLTSPEFTTAFQVWIRMRKEGSVYPGEELMEDEQAKMAFATDRAAFFFGGDWVVGNVLSYNPEADFDLVLPPTPDDGVRRGLYGWTKPRGAFGYVVSSYTKHPRAVWEVIKFLSSLEFQEGYVKGGYGISYLPEANRPENFQVPQLYKFVQWASDPALRRVAPRISIDADRTMAEYLPGMYPIYEDVLDGVYLGKLGMDALKDLEDRTNAALDVAIKKAQENGLKVTRADYIFADWDPMKDYFQKEE